MILLILFSSSVLTQVADRFSEIKSFKCAFIETLTVENDTFKFMGSVSIKKGKARIDVREPEKQIMIFDADSVFIWIEKDKRIKRTRTPISLSQLLFSPEDYYKVDSINNRWVYISPLKLDSTYPLSVQFNDDYFLKKIQFNQEGGKGKFTFYDYKINPEFPLTFFSINSIR